jgi:hypothetical protein
MEIAIFGFLVAPDSFIQKAILSSTECSLTEKKAVLPRPNWICRPAQASVTFADLSHSSAGAV